MRFVLPLFVLLAAALDARARTCWEEAGSRYGVSPYLLYAIARVESDLKSARGQRISSSELGYV